MTTPVFAVLALLLLEGVHGQVGLSCDEGWDLVGYSCFKFFPNEKLDLNGAMEACHMHDGKLAFAESKDELTYLQKKPPQSFSSVYAWRLGYKTYVSSFSSTKTNFVAGPDAKWLQVNTTLLKPPVETIEDPSMNCVAYHSEWWDCTMSREPCAVKLPYACSGPSQGAINPNTSSPLWNITDGIAYYISDPLDAQTHDDAQKSCEGKGLTLLTFSTKNANFVYKKFYNLQTALSNNAWWFGLRPTLTGYAWADNTPLDKTLLKFKKPNPYGINFWVLMSTGLSRIDPLPYGVARPYVCKKKASPQSNFNCPKTWYRGGQSCYYASYGLKLSQPDASAKCSAMGGHLLTVNSKDEKRWLENSGLLRSFYGGLWTSLNDIEKENNFVWHDGSKVDTSLIKWALPLSGYLSASRSSKLAVEGRACVHYATNLKELRVSDCDYSKAAGCQYPLSQSGSTCVKGWTVYEGKCYKTGYSFNDYTPWSMNIATCHTALKSIDPSITPGYIKIDSEGLRDFLSANLRTDVWTGLSTKTSPPVFRWRDGSEPDYSIFASAPEPDNGAGKGEEDCVTIEEGGFYKDTKCDDEAPLVCEREIQFAAGIDGGDGNGSTIPWPSVLSSVLTTCAVVVLAKFSST